jgi:hypothetical protein
MMAVTADGRTITDPTELRAYFESLKPKRGRVKKLVAAKREWQSALQQVAAATVVGIQEEKRK